MAMLRFLSRRLVAQRLLALGVVLTLAFSIGVMASGPIYTDAAREFIVTSSIATATIPTKSIRVDTYWDHSFSWTRADQMVAAAAAETGVPVGQIVRQGEATARVGPQQASVPLLFRDGSQDHLTFRSGAAPGPDEVAITVGLAYSSGLHLGDTLDVLGPTNGRAALRISGIFSPPPDASDPFWFGEGSPFPFNYGDNRDPDPIVVDRDTEQRLSDDLGLTTHLTWDLYLDLSGITYTRAAALPDATTAFSHAMTDGSFVGGQPPNVASGIPVLVAQVQRALIGLRVPILLVLIQVWVVTLVVIAGVGVLLVARQSFELAVLHSRGFTGRTLLLVQAAQAALAAAVALPVGILVGAFLARFAAATNGPRPGNVGFVTHLSGGSLAFAAGAAVTGALVLALPSIPAVRRTILDERRQASRDGHPTLARVPVELIVLPVGLFALALLRNSDTTPAARVGSIDPLLLFGPTLVMLGASFLVVRLLSWLVRSLDGRIGRSKRVASYLAGRRLARAPGIAFASAILVVLSVGLLFLSTSYRATILQGHADAAHAAVGTDWAASVGSPSSGSDRFDEAVPADMAPVATFTLDGFRGRYATEPTGLAIDPASFRAVAWWRSDFASEPFDTLMDRLAPAPVGVSLPGAGALDVTLDAALGDTDLALRATLVRADGTITTTDAEPLVPGTHTYPIDASGANRLLSLTLTRADPTDVRRVGVLVKSVTADGAPVSLDGWTLLPTFGAGGRLARDGTGWSFDGKLGIGGSILGVEPKPPAIPTIVSHDVAGQEGNDPRLWAGDRTVPLGVVGTADAFPGVPPGTPFLIVSGPTLFALQGAVPDSVQRITEVWARGGSDPTAALRDAGYQVGDVASALSVEGRLAQAPQSLAVGLDAAAATAGLGLVIAGVMATLYFAQRRREFEFASLRAMGAKGTTVRDTIAREQIALVGVATVAGIALGDVVLRLVRTQLLTAVTTTFPAPTITVDVRVLVVAVLVIGVAAATAVAAATRAALRAPITTVLRGDPE